MQSSHVFVIKTQKFGLLWWIRVYVYPSHSPLKRTSLLNEKIVLSVFHEMIMIWKIESLLFTVNQVNEEQLSTERRSARSKADWLNWFQSIEMLICYQDYSGQVRGILLMEMKDLFLADCPAYTGFGGRACLKQSLSYRQRLVSSSVCLSHCSNLVSVFFCSWLISDFWQDSISKKNRLKSCLCICSWWVIISFKAGALNECQLCCARCLPEEERFKFYQFLCFGIAELLHLILEKLSLNTI